MILVVFLILILCIIATAFFIMGAHKAVQKDNEELESDQQSQRDDADQDKTEQKGDTSPTSETSNDNSSDNTETDSSSDDTGQTEQ